MNCALRYNMNIHSKEIAMKRPCVMLLSVVAAFKGRIMQ